MEQIEMKGIIMDNGIEKHFKPDFTLKNAIKVIWSKKKQPIILTCKSCPHGVSPEGRGFIYAAAEFGVIVISFVSAILGVLVNRYAPNEWSEIGKILCILILTAVCYSGLLPLFVLLSLRFSKWISAEHLNEKNKQIIEQRPQ